MSLRVTTSKAPVPTTGRPLPPAVLCIRGVWPPPRQLHDLFSIMPDTEILIGDLPGMLSPSRRPSTFEAFSAAYDELIATRLRGRRVIVAGLSAGALVALGLKAAEVSALVLVEPFFSIRTSWPLVDFVQDWIGKTPHQAWFAEELLGITADGVEDRDYSGLLATVRTPVHTIVGDIELGERRPVTAWPSLTDGPTRSLLGALGPVTVGPANTGHDGMIRREGVELLAGVLRETMSELG